MIAFIFYGCRRIQRDYNKEQALKKQQEKERKERNMALAKETKEIKDTTEKPNISLAMEREDSKYDSTEL